MKTPLKFLQAVTFCAAGLVLIDGDLTAHAQPGTEAWVQRYSHDIGSDDRAAKVITDADGEVIVAGTSDAGITGSDWLIIKYSSTGVPLWTNRYDGPGNGDDFVRAVAVDGNGKVLVTGYSTGKGSRYDYATIAYSKAGVPLWTNRYNGTGNNDDAANGLAMNGNGNVFVTGQSQGSSSGWDYATIAYSGAGVPLWTNRYRGPANSEDMASAVAVDGNGRVFVTGHMGQEYGTIAYSGTGVPLWTNRYAGIANAMAVDSNGNVFVTGESAVGGTTIAYSNAGVPLWTNSSSGRGYAMAVGGNGNVFVTGSTASDYETVGYSNSGVPL